MFSIQSTHAQPAARTFTNPIVAPGPDPWIVHHDGWYWFTATAGNRIDIRKALTLASLRDVSPVTIWRADGTPDFGRPIPSGVALPVPAGG